MVAELMFNVLVTLQDFLMQSKAVLRLTEFSCGFWDSTGAELQLSWERTHLVAQYPKILVTMVGGHRLSRVGASTTTISS